ncbi:hypothetical protein SP15_205 [Bacillus phage SP-15]|uniref:Uncharacterized protein n=1 Tax=Bacillus phage SP-15 TaxID=1792032 RepID=A0A127AWI5_9CAUD|nr:hypothetical protein SP15_205 [Bacillus phage SP-15]AMM45005.1 hypothetical protein SP15_205 [Bacillus phage SP-15]
MVDFSKLTNKEKPHVTINGREVEVDSIPDQSLSLEEYLTVRANSAGFEALYPKLSNKALIHASQNTLKNCKIEPSSATYDYTLKTHIVDQLIGRINGMLEGFEEIMDTVGSFYSEGSPEAPRLATDKTLGEVTGELSVIQQVALHHIRGPRSRRKYLEGGATIE